MLTFKRKLSGNKYNVMFSLLLSKLLSAWLKSYRVVIQMKAAGQQGVNEWSEYAANQLFTYSSASCTCSNLSRNSCSFFSLESLLCFVTTWWEIKDFVIRQNVRNLQLLFSRLLIFMPTLTFQYFKQTLTDIWRKDMFQQFYCHLQLQFYQVKVIFRHRRDMWFIQ